MSEFKFKIKGKGLPNMDKDGSDPYFKMKVDGDKIYKSESIKNNCSPEWKEFSIKRSKFGAHPLLCDVELEIYDKDFGRDDYMCSVIFKIGRVLEKDDNEKKYDCFNAKKDIEGQNCGKVSITCHLV